ncbi:MAG: hypothetical protein HY680_01450 [Chloroflexi bacterium]|nr:hypothetical protein [Chloroflexota bacterium]
MHLKPRDLYRLRAAHLHAQRTWLRAQMAQHQVQELALELEQRYSLLAQSASLNIQTGEITITQPEPAAPGQAGLAPKRGE